MRFIFAIDDGDGAGADYTYIYIQVSILICAISADASDKKRCRVAAVLSAVFVNHPRTCHLEPLPPPFLGGRRKVSRIEVESVKCTLMSCM